MPDHGPPRVKEGFSETGSGTGSGQAKSWGLTSSGSLSSLGVASPKIDPVGEGKTSFRSTKSTDLLRSIEAKGLAGYCPRILLKLLKENKGAISFKQLELQAACLFVDVCSFTKITEELKRSVDGSNSIAEHLNQFFALLLDVIAEFNGDVVQFSGDAILAIWPADETGYGIADATKTALSCALRIVATTTNRTISFSAREPPTRLGVHIALGSGDVEFAITGGFNGFWKYMTHGEGIRQAVVIADLAKMDEIVMSNGAMLMVGDTAEASTLPGHPFKVFKLDSLANPVDPAMLSDRETTGSFLPDDPSEEEAFKQGIFSFLSDTVLNTWGRPGELRTVSTLFIRIIGDEETDLASVMHESLTTIQSELAHRDGVLNKVLYDDKGVTLLCVFGLPGHAHEDDAIRSLAFAWGICCKLEGTYSLAFGVSRSKVYCGYCGSDTRREYTVLGDGVNTAARVMQHASAEVSKRRFCDGPVCTVFTDDTTKSQCHSMFKFEGGSEIALKGKLTGCKVWEVTDGNTRIGRRRPLVASSSRPDGLIASPSGTYQHQRTKQRVNSGRRRHEFSTDDLELSEYDSLSGGGADNRVAVQIFGREMQVGAALDAIWSIRGAGVMGMVTPDATHPQQRCVAIYGDAAMGKSVMLRKISEDASHRGVTVIFAQGLQLDRNVPYSCLQVLMTAFGRRSLAWLAVDIDATDTGLRPLLNTFIPSLCIPETPETQALTDSERTEAIQDIATGLLKRAYDGAVLICIDDAHWADPETLAVITHVVKALCNVGAAVTLRSEATIQKGYTIPAVKPKQPRSAADDWGGTNAFIDNQVLSVYLGPLDAQATAALFRRMLGRPVDDQIVSVVHTKSGGNPGFAEQILESLVDQENSPIVMGDKVRFEHGVDVTKINLPDGIEGVIANRVDRLAPQHQHYLKVASVIGPTFSLQLLSKVLRDISLPALGEAFIQLEAAGFVTLLKAEYDQKDTVGTNNNNNSNTTTTPTTNQSAASTSRRTRQGRSSVFSVNSRMQPKTITAGSAAGLVYTFKLHLIVDALYGMLLKKERREFHLSVAEEIESGASVDLQSLIHHYSSAGVHAKALLYLTKATEEALAKGKVMDSTRFSTRALELHDRANEHTNATEDFEDRLRWRGRLCHSQYQAGDFDTSYFNGIEVLKDMNEKIPVGCGMSLFTSFELFKIWMFTKSDTTTPTHNHHQEVLLLVYHALAMISYHNDDQSLMVYFCLRGLATTRGLDCTPPHLRGKRGVLLMLQKLVNVSNPTHATILSTTKRVKDSHPGDKAAVIRLSGLLMLNAGLVKEAEQCLKHRLKGDLELSFLQVIHMSVGICKGLTGKVGDANRRLLSCAKTAHSVHDRRVEAYAMLLSVFVDCCLTGEPSRIQQAGEKLERVAALTLANGGTPWADKRLAALKSAVSGVHALREGGIEQAMRLGFESSLRHIEIRKSAPSFITVVSLNCTLEVMLSVPVIERIRMEKSERDHRRQVTFLLSLLESHADSVVWARPCHALYRGRHEAFNDNRSLAVSYLQRCHNESQMYGTHLFSAHAMVLTATQLSPPESRVEAFMRARVLYTRAGVSEHLQTLYDVPTA